MHAARDYPAHLRRIRCRGPGSDRSLVFLTNHTLLPALTIRASYKSRWQVELLFEWVKLQLAATGGLVAYAATDPVGHSVPENAAATSPYRFCRSDSGSRLR
jgi:hypothetical protein